MQKLMTIASLTTESKGKRTWKKATGQDGQSQNFFPNVPGYQYLAVGAKIQYTIDKNEETGYWDVGDITLVSSAPAAKQNLAAKAEAMGATVTSTDDPKLRAFAVSYAKDLVVAGKCPAHLLPEMAAALYQMMQGNWAVDEGSTANIFELVKESGDVPF